MRLRVTPKTLVKPPPIRILPSGWRTTTYTGPFAFGSKPSSAEPPSVVGKRKRETSELPCAENVGTENRLAESRDEIFGWANTLENHPRPRSSRKMQAKMIN